MEFQSPQIQESLRSVLTLRSFEWTSEYESREILHALAENSEDIDYVDLKSYKSQVRPLLNISGENYLSKLVGSEFYLKTYTVSARLSRYLLFQYRFYGYVDGNTIYFSIGVSKGRFYSILIFHILLTLVLLGSFYFNNDISMLVLFFLAMIASLSMLIAPYFLKKKDFKELVGVK